MADYQIRKPTILSKGRMKRSVIMIQKPGGNKDASRPEYMSVGGGILPVEETHIYRMFDIGWYRDSDGAVVTYFGWKNRMCGMGSPKKSKMGREHKRDPLPALVEPVEMNPVLFEDANPNDGVAFYEDTKKALYIGNPYNATWFAKNNRGVTSLHKVQYLLMLAQMVGNGRRLYRGDTLVFLGTREQAQDWANIHCPKSWTTLRVEKF